MTSVLVFVKEYDVLAIISVSGKDINPDVLGYIFEQYINDRAQMGAYYTKEDISEFRKDGEVWTFLRESGDRYVFDAVKHGYSSDWRKRIPENIACGLLRPDEDASKPVTESGLHLLERRKDWNRPTPEPFAFPTEIWRETIERLSRCEEIIGKIASGGDNDHQRLHHLQSRHSSVRLRPVAVNRQPLLCRQVLHMIISFLLSYPQNIENELETLSNRMEDKLRENAIYYDINSKTRGVNTAVTYQKYCSKSIIDEIDKVLARHYGFTEEELDFIINYDIKYRMGDELNGSEE